MVFNLSYPKEVYDLFECRGGDYDTSRPVIVKYERLTQDIINLLGEIAKEVGAFIITSYDKLPSQEQMRLRQVNLQGTKGVYNYADTFKVSFKQNDYNCPTKANYFYEEESEVEAEDW